MKRKMSMVMSLFVCIFLMLGISNIQSFITNAVPQTPVNLGLAGNFVVLAESGISNVPTSTITGDIGVSPITSTAITGFPLTMNSTNTFSTTPEVNGKVYAANYAPPTPSMMTTAVSDMEAAYTDAAGRVLPDHTGLGAGNIGGMTLSAGLYKWSTGVIIPTDVTLSGSASDVWIFQIAQNLDISSATHVILGGSAQAQNIFWQVAGQTTLETNSTFYGTILCKTLIAMQAGATLYGRALAQTAVTLISNTITGVTSPTPIYYTLTISKAACYPNKFAWGSTYPSFGDYSYQQGTLVQVTATPLGPSWYLEKWTLDGIDYANVTTFTVLMNSNHTLVATFNPVSTPVLPPPLPPPPPPLPPPESTWYTLIVMTTACNGSTSGFGTVTINTARYPNGTIVPVTAHPSAGWYFLGWSLDGVMLSRDTTITITMNSNHALVAIFNPTVLPPRNGTHCVTPPRNTHGQTDYPHQETHTDEQIVLE